MALEIQNLSVKIGQRAVLNEVSLRVAPGELLCIIGPNGSGKSTLLRAICDLLRVQSGAISFDGATLPQERAARAKIVALLPQTPGSDNEITLEEMTMLGRTPHLSAYGAPSQRDFEAVESAISLAAPDLRSRKIGELSGGERQRALLCRALATTAPVLLLDEPVSALDVRHQHEILGLIRRLTRERNLATICVLHGINLASSIADSMILLGKDGRIVAAGTPEIVMTSEHLSDVYQAPLRVVSHPLSGKPMAQSWWEFE
ncbi:iron complex transport system ATP-binding protein [Abditibacterium utsteinense]|uniref:Iron complex transport system ATP-binding protein n=1 Tax=Abditibacterium utsteinense TaxID=1960156 RepID=A0A2S8SUW7_9BACT|nr:ABC transporter ATP-binding protein [Abditibacterium utsteinense]PQV64598.1 iron complex transport system ATP-binding protein [Abditibacterium utsteinense]